LPKYGIAHGLKNWAAAYATGLLVARRAVQKVGLSEKYEGVVEPDGSHTLTERVNSDDPKPFKVFLDVGLRRTSTGSRVFGALKGASDGGLFIPHGDNRFPGYDSESKSLDADTLKKYIFGGHIGEYMDALEEDDEEKYKRQFAKYLEDDIDSESLEEVYKAAHAKIREDPTFTPTEKKPNYDESKKYKNKKLTREERKARVQEKLKQIQQEREEA
jgi:large subunit ribosomal protein L5e